LISVAALSWMRAISVAALSPDFGVDVALGIQRVGPMVMGGPGVGHGVVQYGTTLAVANINGNGERSSVLTYARPSHHHLTHPLNS